jgi:hypothetical protein
MFLRLIIAAFLVFILLGGWTWFSTDEPEKPLSEEERRIISETACMNAMLKEMRAEKAKAMCTDSPGRR